MDIIGEIINNGQVRIIFILALICVFSDVITGVLAVMRSGEFTAARLADFLDTHIVKRVLPILLSAGIGAALMAVGTQPDADPTVGTIGSATMLGAWGAILAYVYETLGSLGVPVPGADTSKGNVQRLVTGSPSA